MLVEIFDLLRDARQWFSLTADKQCCMSDTFPSVNTRRRPFSNLARIARHSFLYQLGTRLFPKGLHLAHEALISFFVGLVVPPSTFSESVRVFLPAEFSVICRGLGRKWYDVFAPLPWRYNLRSVRINKILKILLKKLLQTMKKQRKAKKSKEKEQIALTPHYASQPTPPRSNRKSPSNSPASPSPSP